jgi:hypothetical protein
MAIILIKCCALVQPLEREGKLMMTTTYFGVGQLMSSISVVHLNRQQSALFAMKIPVFYRNTI